MSPNEVFQWANTAALVAWLLLIIIPNKKITIWLVRSGLTCLLLAVLYIIYLFGNLDTDGNMAEAFSTLEGIMSLNSNAALALAGWIHYLAFDMLVGIWEVSNARKLGLPHWVIVPALIFTFMLGPFGLLLYFVIRSIYLKKVSLEAI